MKKLIINISFFDDSVVEKLFEDFDLEKEASKDDTYYSFEYDDEEAEEVEAANEFEKEVIDLLRENKIAFSIIKKKTIQYKNNETLWSLENELKEQNFVKIGDCFWYQMFEKENEIIILERI